MMPPRLGDSLRMWEAQATGPRLVEMGDYLGQPPTPGLTTASTRAASVTGRSLAQILACTGDSGRDPVNQCCGLKLLSFGVAFIAANRLSSPIKNVLGSRDPRRPCGGLFMVTNPERTPSPRSMVSLHSLQCGLTLPALISSSHSHSPGVC